jgi:hypothetical protein
MNEDTPWIGDFKKQVKDIFSVDTKTGDDLISLKKKDVTKGLFSGKDFPMHAVSSEV